MSVRVGALFAGYGGLELAVHRVWPSARPVWFSQFDPTQTRQAPSMILGRHWPDVPNHGDVTRIDWSVVTPVDVLSLGFPCQDVSPAGKRAGLLRGSNRSGLWSYARDAIDALRPRLVVIENVRGLLSAKANSDVEPCPWCMGGAGDGEPALRALGAVLGDLADIGYDAAWVGLRAADVGAPHGRFRVFVLAWPQGDRSALTWPQGDRSALTWPQGDRSALLPTPAVNDMGASYTPDGWDEWCAKQKAEHGNGNGHGASLSIEALRMLPTPTSSDRFGAGDHGDGGADLRTAVSLLPTPRATDGTKGGPNQRGSSGDLMLPSAVLLPTPRATRGGSGTETMYGLGAERSDDERPQGRVLLPTPTAMDSKASGGAVGSSDVTLTDATVRTAERGIDFGVYAAAIARWETVLGRPAPSPTEPTGRDGGQRLSPRFVEWMQGLDDGWVTGTPGITRNDMLKALGNGVVPQQAETAIRHLLTVQADALSGRWAA